MNDEKELSVEFAAGKFPDGHPAKGAIRLVVCDRGAEMRLPYREPRNAVFRGADDPIYPAAWIHELVAPEVWSDGIGYGYGPETNCVVVFKERG